MPNRSSATGKPISAVRSIDGTSGTGDRMPMTVNHSLPMKTWGDPSSESMPRSSAVFAPRTTAG